MLDVKYTINNHKHIYKKDNPDNCDLCGLLKSTIENCKLVTTNFQKPSNKLVTKEKPKKIAQCFCQSFYDEHGIIHNCTCGKCGVTLDQLLKRIEALEKWKTGKDKAYPNMGS